METIEQRLLKLLHEHAKEYGDENGCELTVSGAARHLETSPQYIGKIARKMEADGVTVDNLNDGFGVTIFWERPTEPLNLEELDHVE